MIGVHCALVCCTAVTYADKRSRGFGPLGTGEAGMVVSGAFEWEHSGEEVLWT
jgi:hypothetical protein